MASKFPEFQLAATTHPGTVALKVADLEKLTKFYQEVIGLTILQKSPQQTVLGVTVGQPLLILNQVEHPLPLTRQTGLYHVAFLLPDRSALGDALIHYLTVNAPISGASDHGYSEALYLTDPEGNGIEVYRDKPMDVWDIREDGEIFGITIEMDADGVAQAATGTWRGFPQGTTVGHVHLKVADLNQTEDFYTEGLGLALKLDFGTQAKFLATGLYHHHIGANTWTGRQLPAMSANDLGLDYFSFFVANQLELDRIERHWKEKSLAFEKNSDGSLWVTDPSGIRMKFEIEPK